jgi:hypothetical protein
MGWSKWQFLITAAHGANAANKNLYGHTMFKMLEWFSNALPKPVCKPKKVGKEYFSLTKQLE